MNPPQTRTSREINLVHSTETFDAYRKLAKHSICSSSEHLRLHIFDPLLIATLFLSLPLFLLSDWIITLSSKCRFRRYALLKITEKLHIMIHASLTFGMDSRVILDKVRSIAKSIHGSSFRWEKFEQACKSYDMEPMMIPLDITIQWNSAFRMLLHAVYLHRPIHWYVDDCSAKTKPETLKQKWEEMQLTNAEWEQAEVLLMFLESSPLQVMHCPLWMQQLFSRDRLCIFRIQHDVWPHGWRQIEVGKWHQHWRSPVRKVHAQSYWRDGKSAQKYYTKTSFPTVYSDGMILNPRMKLIIFEEESWVDINAEEYSNAVVDIFFNNTTNLNPILPSSSLRGSPIVQTVTNVRRHITMIQNIVKSFSIIHLNDVVMISIVTSRSPMISISHLHLIDGEIIIINI